MNLIGQVKKHVESIDRTNRSWFEIKLIYKDGTIEKENLLGQKILDLGAGGGRFVQEMRDAGLDAYALEAALSSEQRPHIYQGLASLVISPTGLILDGNRGQGYYVEADAINTGLASEQFDLVISNLSVFLHSFDLEILNGAFKESRRILKPRGKLLLGHPNSVTQELIRRGAVPGFRVIDQYEGDSSMRSIILQKIR